MKMRFVLFLALLVAAWHPVCAQDLFQATAHRDPEPNGSAKRAPTGVTPDSRELAGVYGGDAAVITVSKMNEAWEVNCVLNGKVYNASHTYLSATPFNGELRLHGATFNCKTGKKKTTDIYRI